MVPAGDREILGKEHSWIQGGYSREMEGVFFVEKASPSQRLKKKGGLRWGAATGRVFSPCGGGLP